MNIHNLFSSYQNSVIIRLIWQSGGMPDLWDSNSCEI